MKRKSEPGERQRSIETARRVLQVESAAVAALASRVDDGFERAVRQILDCSGRLVVTGMGKSGIVCQKIAATMSSTGTPALFMHPAEAIHGDLGMIVDGDIVLIVSNSGETQEVVRLLELVRRLGAGIIAMTGDPQSTLAQHADVSLDVGVDREACSLDLVPTASTCAQMAMGDALAVACYEARGFTPDDFARFHPGGRLGHKLRLVSSVMHAGDAAPSVHEHAPMADVVEEISTRHLGMTCVVDGAGRLLGVITDGDLRRALAKRQLQLDASASRYMTPSAVTIGPEAVAAEALKLMEQRRITALPVVDAGRRLLGVIHLHDLWRTDLF